MAGCNSNSPDKFLAEHETLDYNGKATVLIRVPGPYQSDTIYFENGVASYTPNRYIGEIGWIYATDIDPNLVHRVILDECTIRISATKDSMIFVSGTPNNDALFSLDWEVEPLRRKMKENSYKAVDLIRDNKQEEADIFLDENKGLSDTYWSSLREFTLSNKNMAGLSYVSRICPWKASIRS